MEREREKVGIGQGEKIKDKEKVIYSAWPFFCFTGILAELFPTPTQT